MGETDWEAIVLGTLGASAAQFPFMLIAGIFWGTGPNSYIWNPVWNPGRSVLETTVALYSQPPIWFYGVRLAVAIVVSAAILWYIEPRAPDLDGAEI